MDSWMDFTRIQKENASYLFYSCFNEIISQLSPHNNTVRTVQHDACHVRLILFLFLFFYSGPGFLVRVVRRDFRNRKQMQTS